MSDFISELGMRNSADAAAVLVDRTYNEGLPDQYKRELVWNSVQAGARTIYASATRLPGGDGQVPSGVKAAFVDDGEGMAPEKLLDYFGELFNGRSDLSPDGNFQMGARVSTLPWNPLGVIVASWTDGDPDGAALWIAYDVSTRVYRFRPYYDEEGAPYEVGTPDAWMRHPAIAKAGHGTVVILLGAEWSDHTVGEIDRAPDGTFRYPSVRHTDADMHYYNAKWRRLPEGVTLSYMWSTDDLDSWDRLEPGTFYEQHPPVKGSVFGSHRSYHGGVATGYRIVGGVNRQVRKYAKHSGTVEVTSIKGYPATVHWALFPREGEQLARHTDRGGGSSQDRDRYIPLGLFGELYGDELYGVRHHGATYPVMERYGLTDVKLRSRMVIMVEPHAQSTQFIGARPVGSRKHLVIANGELPHDEWGEQFIAALPTPVREALRELSGDRGEDDTKRQQDRAKFLRRFFGLQAKRATEGAPAEAVDVPAGRQRQTDPRDHEAVDTPVHGRGQSGHAAGTAASLSTEGGIQGRSHQSRPPRTINHEWTAEPFDPETGQPELLGLAAHWAAGPRLLQLNPEHPVIRELIEGEVRLRPTRADDVRKYAKEAIASHLVDLITAADIFSSSPMAQGHTQGRSFVKAAITDATLTAVLVNVTAMQAVVRSNFRGRPGFRVRIDEGLVTNDMIVEAGAVA